VILLLFLLLAACSPASTPEAFGPEYGERWCTVLDGCGLLDGVAPSYDACVSTMADHYTSDRCPEWDPDLGAACLEALDAAEGCGMPAGCEYAADLGCEWAPL
jgi:hypothetical protein